MKKILQLIAFLFAVINANAQFSPVVMIDSLSTENVSQVMAADFTNDGLKDVLVSATGFPLDKMILFTNLGSDDFSQQTLASLNDIRSFDIADLNNDGRPDFAVSYENTSLIDWYENTPGGFVPHPMVTANDFTDKILLRDFDNNGSTDLLAMEHTEIVFYPALAPGVLDTAHVIHGGTEFYAIDVADYNNDGLPDVAAGSSGFEVLLNNGSGGFTLASLSGFLLTFGLQSGDMDNDNDVDIVSYETAIGLVYYANDGSGQFTLADTVLDYSDHFKIYGLADLDCDSDLDIYTSLSQVHQLVWMETTGSATFSAPNVVYTETGSLLNATASADMNNDTEPDLLWGAYHIGMHYNLCGSLSVDETAKDDVLIYPNPATDHVNISNSSKADLLFTLYDVTGRKLDSKNCSRSGTVTVALPATGMYLIEGKTEAGERLVCRKIIR